MGVSESSLVEPVIEETADVHPSTEETGRDRFRKTVHEREEIIDPALLRDEVRIERVPVNRIVDGASPVRSEGNTLIIPFFRRGGCGEKRLLLKEELRITTQRVETHTPQRVTFAVKRRSWSASTEHTTRVTLAHRSFVMAKTVIGFFEQVSKAQRVLQDLLEHGFDRDRISLIAHQERSGLKLAVPGEPT